MKSVIIASKGKVTGLLVSQLEALYTYVDSIAKLYMTNDAVRIEES
jgi:hypothetical protein